MNSIKKWFSEWDLAKIVRVILTVALTIAYFTTKEEMYLVGAIFLGVQAIFNIGCAGNACQTNIPEQKNKQIIKTEKLNLPKD